MFLNTAIAKFETLRDSLSSGTIQTTERAEHGGPWKDISNQSIFSSHSIPTTSRFVPSANPTVKA